MGKKTVLQGLIAIAGVALIGVLLYFMLGNPTVDTSQVTKVTAYGINMETGRVSTEVLSDVDANVVTEIFNGKEKSFDGPGDVFSENCAFVLTDGDSEYYFCLATDESNFVCSANDDMYFEITEDEKDELLDLLRDYCGYR
ncbi:MAG: hypothetical protein E7388_00565 [Ruminococcaceae bacterium]|nr:hypothetical protein [Oscillospiraceae bacterium]